MKLMFAKIIITLCWCVLSIPPILFTWLTQASNLTKRGPEAQFVINWLLSSHLFCLPLIFYLVWSSLHGTGRSVRMAAYFGMAYTVAFFVTYARRGTLKPDGMSMSAFDSMIDQTTHMYLCGGLFVVLLIAVILSVKPKKLSQK